MDADSIPEPDPDVLRLLQQRIMQRVQQEKATDAQTGVSIRFVQSFDASSAQKITDEDVRLLQASYRKCLERQADRRFLADLGIAPLE